jgi:hypothetical protein
MLVFRYLRQKDLKKTRENSAGSPVFHPIDSAETRVHPAAGEGPFRAERKRCSLKIVLKLLYIVNFFL